jgi:hypothetical protein
MLLLFGIALVMNTGSVAAVNSTNGVVHTNTSGSITDQNKTNSTLSTTLKVSTSAAASTQTKTVASVNTYGLTLTQIKDGLNRAQTFYNNNNRLPNYVSYGTKQIPIATFNQILAANGLKIVINTPKNVWIIDKNVVYSQQTTSYTCGPASLKMDFSNYGMNLNEMGLASYAGSNTNTGSTEAGLINAVNKVNLKYGTHFKAWDQTFASVGWTGLYNSLSHNNPVILHIRSFLNPNGGHYVLLTGINLYLKQVKIADPSYGYRILSFSDLTTRLNWIVSTGRSSNPLFFLTKT